jgi:hypothetical protein|tara:strand:+ start:1270 stop:1857 length:588 start_codon:yes stop_codon:yes gene_type:complete
MAQPSVVRKCLSAIASNYSKNEQWVEDNLKLWVGGLMAVTDKDLARGTETWCRTKNMAPNLARLRAIIEADPTTKTATVYNGCPACDQTGWREMAGHYENKNGEPAVLTCVAACDCQRGQRFAAGPAMLFSDVVRMWRSKGYHPIYFSTVQQPHLTTQQRHTAKQIEHMEKLKDDQLNKTRMSGFKSSWQSVVDR